MLDATVLSKYLDSGIFEAEGRFYKLSRLSAWDYFTTTELLDDISRYGTPSASFLVGMLPFQLTPEEMTNAGRQILPGPPGPDGQLTERIVELTEDEYDRNIDQLMEQKRNAFTMVLSPILGVSQVKDKVVKWLSEHLFFVPDPENPKMNVKAVSAEDFQDPDVLPLSVIPKIFNAIYRHPDIRSFFTEAQTAMGRSLA